ncbi:MAG: DoxX family protein [Microbacteriaceae bacterium]
MLIAYWIVAGLLALAMLAAGAMKTVRPKPQLHAAGMAWVEDFSATQVKLIGIAEVLGALGLVLPMLTGIAPILSPIAAAALLVIMIGAAVVHVRRAEPPVPGMVLSALAAAATVLGLVVVQG